MRLKLSNWMAFSRLEWEPEPGVAHVLAGPNGAGKSSILDAILWCLTGESRGFGARDLSVFRSGTGPCSVELVFAVRPPGWPASVARGTRVAVSEDQPGAFVARKSQVADVLGTWDLVRTDPKRRGALLAALVRAGVGDDELLAAIRRVCPVPPPGQYGGHEWGNFGSVDRALAQAVEIRKSYFGAARAKVAESDVAEVERLRTALAALAPPGPEPAAPAGVVTQEQADRAARPDLDCLARCRHAREALEDVRARLAAPYPGAVAIVDARLAAIAAEADVAQAALDSRAAAFLAGQEAAKAHAAALAAWRRVESDRARLSAALTAAETRMAGVESARADAAARRASWDAICDALAPAGPVAAALVAAAGGGVDRERLAWAADVLGVPVSLDDAGLVLVGGREPALASHGQSMLAGLAVQDALCRLAEIPVYVADGLESLDVPNRTRALEFLAGIAPDYDCVVAGSCAPVAAAEGVRVWRPDRGQLRAV